MKFDLKHILFVVFIIAFALWIRTSAIAHENDAITGIGVLVVSFIAAFGLTILKSNRWMAWLTGVATAFAMCTIDTIERGFKNPEMEYLWRDPVQGQYATDPELGVIMIIVFTLFSVIISGVGIGAGVLLNKCTKKNG